MNVDEWNEVNSPSHYNSNTMETIDLIRDSMEPEEYRGYLKGNIFNLSEINPLKFCLNQFCS